jgi:hypothetical protein
MHPIGALWYHNHRLHHYYFIAYRERYICAEIIKQMVLKKEQVGVHKPKVDEEKRNLKKFCEELIAYFV